MTTRKRIPDFAWVFMLLAAALIVMGILSPGTLTVLHLMDLMRQAAPLGVAAAGQTLLLMSGNIDLSFGAQITLCNPTLDSQPQEETPAPCYPLSDWRRPGTVGRSDHGSGSQAEDPCFRGYSGHRAAPYRVDPYLHPGRPVRQHRA